VQAQARWRTSWSERLLQPTLAVAGPGAIAPPDLVLWPESSLPMHDVVERGNGQGPEFRALDGIALHERVRLCVGAGSVRDPEQPSTPAAVLVDARGRYLGHQEKRRLVPGGEFLPFARWLPRALLEPFERAMRTAVRFEPVQSGRPLPLLQTAAGIPFAALVCYDNAFPGVAADEVREGARLLVVLSNESWYRGGGELDQLAAITVVRALATATPFVRCTTDGLSLAVDGSGHVVAALPRQPTPTPAARILQVSLAVGPGLLPPLAWLHPWLGWTLSAMVLLALLHPLIAWARLRWLGRTPAGGAGGGPRPALPAGGS
jgi:apolipoprotein N-acyltransferase